MAARLSWASVRLNVLAASLSVMKRPQNAWVDPLSLHGASGIRETRRFASRPRLASRAAPRYLAPCRTSCC